MQFSHSTGFTALGGLLSTEIDLPLQMFDPLSTPIIVSVTWGTLVPTSCGSGVSMNLCRENVLLRFSKAVFCVFEQMKFCLTPFYWGEKADISATDISNTDTLTHEIRGNVKIRAYFPLYVPSLDTIIQSQTRVLHYKIVGLIQVLNSKAVFEHECWMSTDKKMKVQQTSPQNETTSMI